jgi:class 3 adenylate cyclase/predicted ATPase
VRRGKLGAISANGSNALTFVICAACGSESPADKKFCGDCGAELASGTLRAEEVFQSQSPTQTQAERRRLTVMFCDLVGSTALSARLDPEDLREVIGLYHRCVAQVVAQFDGFVAQYVGDGALIYFGYPRAHEDDAERAVRSGLALIEAVKRLAPAEPLQIRIGIGTGVVVVGDLIGSGEATLRVVLGETPNLAARLQTVAEPSAVVIDAQTRSLLGDLFELRALGARELKGFAEPVQAWQVTRPSGIESRFEALHPGTLVPLVGREAEMGMLLRQWERVKLGEGAAVLLSGEAGIGKSRLAAALSERISAEPHARLRYFCSPYHTDSMLHPIIGQLERAAGFTSQDGAQSKLSKLDALLSGSSTSPQDAALFAELLSLPNDGRYPNLDLTPEQRRAKIFEALASQLTTLAGQLPVLMIFEDAHWMDATSLEALGRTVDRIRTLPILLIVTFRPEFRTPWAGQSHVTTLTLNRLGSREVGTMIRHIAGSNPLPVEIMVEIIERTDGVPLFVEEMTRAVLESAGSETEARQAVSAIPSSTLALPATLHASLMARLDRLGPAKEIAQIGAAIGRQFSYRLIAAVARHSDEKLHAALDRLVDAGLVVRQGALPHASFLFRHALLQDAAHGTLLRERRRDLHARIAAALVQSFPDSPNTQPEILAHHYTEAGLIEQAASFWGKAGLKSIARSALKEGVAQLTKALNQIASLPEATAIRHEQMKLQLSLAAALIHVKGYSSPEVIAAFEHARLMIHHAESLDGMLDPMLRFSALYGPWAVKFVAFDGDIALARAREILSLAEKTGSTAPLILGHRAAGQTLVGLGQFGAGRTHLDRAIALYSPDEHRPLAARFAGQDLAVAALSYRSWALWHLGYPDAALKDVDLGLRNAREVGLATSLLYALFHFSVVEILCGRIDLGAAFAREMVSVAEEKGASFWWGPGLILQGWTACIRGQAEGAAETITAGLRAFETTGSTVFRPMFLTALARAHANCGGIECARDFISQALAAVQKTKECWAAAEIHRTAGELSLLSADPDLEEAEHQFQQSLSIAREQNARSSELRAATNLARLWAERGKGVEARNLLAPIHGWFVEGFDTADLKEAKVLLDELT